MTPFLPEIAGVRTLGDRFAFAVTTEDDRYRYLLGRNWGRGPIWVWCMINPSTARHDKTDQTLGKVIGFSKRAGAAGVLLINLFAYSATDPKDLERAYRAGVDIVGEHSAKAMMGALALAKDGGRLLSAWGRIPPSLREASHTSVARWASIAKPMGTRCLGFTREGYPRHPLMLGYDTPIVPFWGRLVSTMEKHRAGKLIPMAEMRSRLLGKEP